MKYLLFVFLIASTIHCSNVPQAPTDRTYQLGDNLPLTATNMKHGWSDVPSSETKSFRTDSDAIERGRKLYEHHCQQCHGTKGLGDGELAKTLKIKPTNLTNISPKIPEAYLLIQINKGKGSMPKWESFLTSKQTWELSQYVLFLNREK